MAGKPNPLLLASAAAYFVASSAAIFAGDELLSAALGTALGLYGLIALAFGARLFLPAREVKSL